MFVHLKHFHYIVEERRREKKNILFANFVAVFVVVHSKKDLPSILHHLLAGLSFNSNHITDEAICDFYFVNSSVNVTCNGQKQVRK